MSEARSLTQLSDSDYEAIEAAVMETARGRWFMAEYAKRNRQADTGRLLGAIARIERAVGLAAPQPEAELPVSETAALIADLRIDLERVSGRSEDAGSGLAARVEAAAVRIMAAIESVQEVAWNLREAGADEALCDTLDRRGSEIHTAAAVIEGASHQVGKVADTVAMLDSTLRALSEQAAAPSAPAPEHQASSRRPIQQDAAYGDIQIIEIDDHPELSHRQTQFTPLLPLPERTPAPTALFIDDLDFDEIGTDAPAPLLQAAQIATSEAALRDLDALSAERKLAYFA